jgi:hypothetical protein
MVNSDTAPQGSARERRIVAAHVIVTCPGRNFVTLKIETGSGVLEPNITRQNTKQP